MYRQQGLRQGYTVNVQKGYEIEYIVRVAAKGCLYKNEYEFICTSMSIFVVKYNIIF